MGYIFDPDFMHGVCQKSLGLPKDDMFDQITADLDDEYHGHVYTGRRRWILSGAGGVVGQISVLHASVTEYVLLFGAPLPTSGRRGRHRTTIWGFYLEGAVNLFEEGELGRRAYGAGDFEILRKGHSAGVEVAEGTWLLQYARGPISSMTQYAVGDSLRIGDRRAAVATLARFARLGGGQLLRGKI